MSGRNILKSKFIFFVALVVLPSFVFGQKDSTIVLEETLVRGFETNQSNLKTAASVSKISTRQIEQFGNTNLTYAINSQAGVRMEERSPGSYRLAIRGSSLRSPFGVRNVKVYLNGIPISDANGITYFNQIDMNALQSIEILKGPSGSIFGAGIGGVLNLKTKAASAGQTASAGIHVGSFGTVNSRIGYQFGSAKNNTTINFSQNTSDGYRANSALKRAGLTLHSDFFLKPNHTLSVFSYLAQTNYQTPGGLTLAQMQANRKAARLATSTLPSAEAQKAAIDQKITYLALSDLVFFKNNWSLHSTLTFNTGHLQNPFITNFEDRKEHSLGARSVLKRNFEEKGINLVFGFEGMQTNSSFDVFVNNAGQKGMLQGYDNVKSFQGSLFGQIEKTLFSDLIFTAGLSFNAQKSQVDHLVAGKELVKLNYAAKVPVAPRVAILKPLGNHFSAYASYSFGFSSPTVQEITSTLQYAQDVDLLPEKGNNTEFGIKFSDKKLSFDVAVFSLEVQDGLVRFTNSTGNEYFKNVGNLVQRGLETQFRYQIVNPNTEKFIQDASVSASLTLNDFTYKKYELSSTVNYNDKNLPGVAKQNLFVSASLVQKSGVYLNLAINYLSKMPLKDDNTVYADAAWMSQVRLGYKKGFRKLAAKVYLGAENLFNQAYSFGYDFNAFGNRFYNPAPLRNYNGGVELSFKF
jgi:iron complex outermembrane recepter protein